MTTITPTTFTSETGTAARREFEKRISQLREANRLTEVETAALTQATASSDSFEAWSERVEAECDRLDVVGAERAYLHSVPDGAASGMEPMTWADATRKAMHDDLRRSTAATQRSEHDSRALMTPAPAW